MLGLYYFLPASNLYTLSVSMATVTHTHTYDQTYSRSPTVVIGRQLTWRGWSNTHVPPSLKGTAGGDEHISHYRRRNLKKN